eukprot:SAG11_NODE_1081_length_5956_cov_14.482506_3_plen_65_part_00
MELVAAVGLPKCLRKAVATWILLAAASTLEVCQYCRAVHAVFVLSWSHRVGEGEQECCWPAAPH